MLVSAYCTGDARAGLKPACQPKFMKGPAKNRSSKRVKKMTVAPAQAAAHARLLTAAWKEALADLTPGLAHDFNNALTGIVTMSEACLAQIDAAHPFHEGLAMIKHKSQEASHLRHRLARLHQEKAGFCDYQDANAIVAEMLQLLRSVFPRRIEIKADFTSDSLPVYVDAVEFRRAILSLSTRALDSISGAGKLHFKTSRHQTLPALNYFQGKPPRLPATSLSITDSGDGLDAKKLDLLVKAKGPSSSVFLNGLALSFQHARHFVEQSGGAISVESKPGAGTIFRLWLPEADFTEAGNVFEP